MNMTIKIGLTVILLSAICCKKENNNLQSSITATNVSDMVAGKYSSVRIGTQQWMNRNLDVTHYRNGDKIPHVKSKADWTSLTTGAWCWYNNDSANGAVYGKLYNWYAVNDPGGLAPVGWHIPTDAEWDTLTAHLGNNAGGKLKDTGTIEAGTGLWYAPNYAASNKSGFTGLPGGIRSTNGPFERIGAYGFWWSATQQDLTTAWYRYLYYDVGSVSRYNATIRYGFSVRCIKD